MTQTQSIQQNIHEVKKSLFSARKVIPCNELEKAHINGSIQYYLNELSQLKESLRLSIK